MLNLYWKSGDQTRSLVEKSFKTEAELEQYIFENQEILGGDIYIIHRQIRTGSKQGIPDMLGVDQDSRVCIIELKNSEADENILPQALGYAIWAETNPDSIKAIWLESKNKPEDIEVDWDNLDIRIILIAPSFKSTVPRMAGKIGYPVDLIQVRRYCFEDEEFLVVEVLEDTPERRVTTTKVQGEWDWDFYESEHGKEATVQFRKVVEAIAALVDRQGWKLPYNLSKYYVGFKLGNRVVFSVGWGGTYAWNLRLKLPEDVAKAFKGKLWEFQRYDNSFHEAVFRPLNPDLPDISEMEPLFIEAYQYVSGRK
ncbi:MAG: hypothetical protein DRP95_06960 [Candidatus Latescibacterota bacterium]|nr:MAG: hypothetical protein DRP95_06960 [Candidatus Latescibacterota bacterium]